MSELDRIEDLTELWLYQIPDGEENGLDGESGTPSGMLFYATTEAAAKQIQELGYPIEKVVLASQVKKLREALKAGVAWHDEKFPNSPSGVADDLAAVIELQRAALGS